MDRPNRLADSPEWTWRLLPSRADLIREVGSVPEIRGLSFREPSRAACSFGGSTQSRRVDAELEQLAAAEEAHRDLLAVGMFESRISVDRHVAQLEAELGRQLAQYSHRLVAQAAVAGAIDHKLVPVGGVSIVARFHAGNRIGETARTTTVSGEERGRSRDGTASVSRAIRLRR